MKKLIAIDCGGTNLRVAAVDENIEILAVRRIPTIHDNPYLLFTTMVKLLEEVKEEAKFNTIDAIGMSMCGLVQDNDVGRCGNLGIDSYDFKTLFEEKYPKAKLYFANDANCSALVEAEFGANKGLSNSGFVTISTGIGLGVVHRGEMIDLPLEGGRLLMEYKNKMYEAEYLLSGNGIVNLSKINDVFVKDAAEFFSLVREKDQTILKVYDEWLKLLAMWFANMHLLFNLDQYSVSGGVMKSGDLFLADLEHIANAYITSWHLKPIKLVRAKYDQDVGLKAAATLALHAAKGRK